MRSKYYFASACVLALLLAGCGVPREAGRLAIAGKAAMVSVPADPAAVRQALLNEGDAWTHLASVLMDHEIGGIQGVDEKFIALVVQTAALARRQRELIERGEDDPVQNQIVLQKLQALWNETNAYLNP